MKEEDYQFAIEWVKQNINIDSNPMTVLVISQLIAALFEKSLDQVTKEFEIAY